ncbi:MAG TPA: hypothetical protein VFO18_06085 [Methylomirabilota bacterium]|nr:hypothetical protein [Methylomirabilota bacterium]
MVILAAALVAACSASPPHPPPSADHSAPLRAVYFIPIEGFPALLLDDLAKYCKDRFNLTVQIRPPVILETGATDPSRQQLVAEELTTLIQRGNPSLASDPSSLLIGFTTSDMYARAQPNWRFVFGWRQEGRFAVISSARLDPRTIGEVADNEVLRARLRKVVARYMGFLYYGLPPSDDRSSVLYRTILGVDELDLIGDGFEATPLLADPDATAIHSYRLPEDGRIELRVPLALREAVSRRPPPQPPLALWLLPVKGDHFEARLHVVGKHPPRPFQLRDAIETLGNRALAHATETSLTLEQLSGADVEGYYFTLMDRSPRGDGRAYTTLALVRVGDLLVTAAMRHQDKEPRERSLLLAMLRTARQLSEN